MDCGNSLDERRGVVAATPPRGLSAAGPTEARPSLVGTSIIDVGGAPNPEPGRALQSGLDARQSPPRPKATPRPAAPHFEFAPKAAVEPGSNFCTRCGTANPQVNRFCRSCGQKLENSRPGAAAILHQEPTAAPPPVAKPVELKASPMLEVVGNPAPASAGAPSLTCSRCQGVNQSGMRYCQFCGASLSAQPNARANPPPKSQMNAPGLPGGPTPARQVSAAGQPGGQPGAIASGAPIVGRAQPAPGNAPPKQAEQPGRRVPLGGQAGPQVAPATQRSAPGQPVPYSAAPQAAPSPAAVQPGAYLEYGASPRANPSVRGLASPPEKPQTAALPAAKLVIVLHDGSSGREYPLADEQVDIGRAEGSILLPGDPYVSPRHARIVKRGQRYFIRDLSSVNGVYVKLTKPESLKNADLLLIGLEVLKFETVSEADSGLGQATEQNTQVFGSPAAPRFARLLQRTVEGVTRNVYYLSREQTVLGREAGDIVFTMDPFMSRRHASIDRKTAHGDFILSDLNSSNGTYLAIRGEQPLSDGDQLRIGQHLFRLEIDRGTKLI